MTLEPAQDEPRQCLQKDVLQEKRNSILQRLQQQHLLSFQEKFQHIKQQQLAQNGWVRSSKRKLEEANEDKPKQARVAAKMCDLYLMGGCAKGEHCLDAHSEEEVIKFPQLPKTSALAEGAESSQPQFSEFGGDSDWSVAVNMPAAVPSFPQVKQLQWSGGGGLYDYDYDYDDHILQQQQQLQRLQSLPLLPELLEQPAWEADPNTGPGGVPVFKPMGPRTTYAYKLVLCKFHQQGRCMKGAACTFAHGDHEVRGSEERQADSAPPEAKGGKEKGSWKGGGKGKQQQHQQEQQLQQEQQMQQQQMQQMQQMLSQAQSGGQAMDQVSAFAGVAGASQDWQYEPQPDVWHQFYAAHWATGAAT